MTYTAPIRPRTADDIPGYVALYASHPEPFARMVADRLCQAGIPAIVETYPDSERMRGTASVWVPRGADREASTALTPMWTERLHAHLSAETCTRNAVSRIAGGDASGAGIIARQAAQYAFSVSPHLRG